LQSSIYNSLLSNLVRLQKIVLSNIGNIVAEKFPLPR